MAVSSEIRTTTRRIPISLVISYIIDWVVIIGIAAVGAGFWKTSPNHRPFSPADPELSFPYVEKTKISTTVLAVVSLVAPAVITLLIALIFTPGPTVPRRTPQVQIWKQKLWEWNTAWMGLGLGLALTFFFTEGMKNLFGKPRPDLLARCDLDPMAVQSYALGGYGNQLPEWNQLVSWTACRQTDRSMLDDGFMSFPSGHSAFSWAGMFYLALYLCSKFGVAIPYLLPYSYSSNSTISAYKVSEAEASQIPLRKQAAAPPTWTVILPLIPISAATYISSTRYSDFRHHGFDIIFGSLMGILLSWISFRLYHLPIRRGSGWSWSPRSASKAWFSGVGVSAYAEEVDHKRLDLETGMHKVNESNRKAYSHDVSGSRSSQ